MGTGSTHRKHGEDRMRSISDMLVERNNRQTPSSQYSAPLSRAK